MRVTADEVPGVVGPQDAPRVEDAGTAWSRLVDAALAAKRNGRTSFYQAVHGSTSRPGWLHQNLTDAKRVKKFLQKVESMSTLGKMNDEVEVLAALTDEQRTQHVWPEQIRARPPKRKAPEVPRTASASEAPQTANDWKQKYTEARLEVDRCEQEIADLMDAVATGQELQNENEELRALVDGVTMENDSLRRQLLAEQERTRDASSSDSSTSDSSD